MSSGTRKLICVVVIISLLSCNVKSECTWQNDDDPNNNYYNRYCRSQSYTALCTGTVQYDLGRCQEDPNSEELVLNYNLKINLDNPDENPFLENVEFYTELSIRDGYLVTIPKEVFNMTKLINIDISGTKLRKINFNDFLPLLELKKISLANNTVIIITTYDESSEYSSVNDIDISFNFIETVPNNFVKRFNKLEYLNLSHNMINNIDKHTFEGAVLLKVLDLSFNRLQEVGNLFVQLPKVVDLKYAISQNLQKLSKLVLDSNQITNINFTDFFATGIPLLSIGANRIPCHLLAEIKYNSQFSEKFDRIVTTQNLDFSSVNINGIRCQESQNEVTNVMVIPESSNSNSSILISILKNAIESNGKSIDSLIEIVNENEKKMERFMTEASVVLVGMSDQLQEINIKLPYPPSLPDTQDASTGVSNVDSDI